VSSHTPPFFPSDVAKWIDANRDALTVAGWRDPRHYQHYWRCAHHTSAIQNFFEQRNSCEWCCHTQELQWYHGGEHPLPKSWSGRLADQIFGGIL
jgi:hypothetical protein